MGKVLFWDFDGTLVMGGTKWSKALEESLRLRGYSIPMEELRDTLRKCYSWEHPEDHYPERTGALWWEDLFQRLLPFLHGWKVTEGDARALFVDFRERRISTKQYTLYPDALETLRECREMGYTSYILSNNYPELPEIVEALGFSPWVADCICSAGVGYEKPRVELFRHALERAGQPAEAWMIGDNPVADIEGGRNAGLRTILVHGDPVPAADAVCRELCEISAALKAAARAVEEGQCSIFI